MRTEYKFIHFSKRYDGSGTGGSILSKSVWECRNNKSNGVLGEIKFYPAWRQYCFFPEFDCVFNNTCLSDIQDFIRQLTQPAS